MERSSRASATVGDNPGEGIDMGAAYSRLAEVETPFSGQEYLDEKGIGDIGIIEVAGHDGKPMSVARALSECPHFVSSIEAAITNAEKYVPVATRGNFLRDLVKDTVAPSEDQKKN
jgi:hypothetical protein